MRDSVKTTGNKNDAPDEKNAPQTLRPLAERLAENFLSSRRIFLWGAVTDRSAQPIVEQMLYLEALAAGQPIYFFINSPGGVITSGMAIYDVMRMIQSPVYTIAMGTAASMGAILLTSGEKNHRYVLEHTNVLIHQPLISGQIVAPALDMRIHAEEIKKTRQRMNRIIAETTGQPLARVEKDTDRDYNLNAHQAVEYGLADKVLTDLSELQPAKPSAARKKVSKPSKTK